MNWQSWLVLASIVAAVAAVVMTKIRNKRKGKSSCGCGCSGCAFRESCHK